MNLKSSNNTIQEILGLLDSVQEQLRDIRDKARELIEKSEEASNDLKKATKKTIEDGEEKPTNDS